MTLRLLFSLITVLSLSGCLQEDTPLRIGTNVWPGYELLYLARDKGLLPENHVRLVELPAATDVMEAVMVGRLEGAAVTLDEAIRLRERGAPVVVILVCDISDGADAVLARESVRDLADIKGRVVAVPFDSVGLLVLDAALTEAGLTLNDITLRDVPPGHHVSVLEQGKADVLVSFEPFTSHLRDRGAVTLFDSSAIRGRIVDVLVVRQEAIDDHPEKVSSLTRGFLEGRRVLMAHREESLAHINRRLQLSPSELQTVYNKLHIPGAEENKRLLDTSSGRLIRTSEALTTLMKLNGMLGSPPDLSGFITDEFIPEP